MVSLLNNCFSAFLSLNSIFANFKSIKYNQHKNRILKWINTCSFRIVFLLALSLLVNQPAACAQSCTSKNKSFQAGEVLKYTVIYNWGMIWLESAYAELRVKEAKYQGKASYHFSGSGGTYPKYDWFFKVRDTFETYVDTTHFQPLKVHATVLEGSKREKHVYFFNYLRKRAYTFVTKGSKPVKIDTVKIQECSIDVLTAIYHARNIDYSHCKPRDTLSISLLLDGKLYAIYIRYLGKETFASKELGTFKCIKFSPLLIEGTIFKAGEGMTVWVTDDENKLPIYVETPITVGTIKVKLVSYKGFRHKLTSKIQ